MQYFRKDFKHSVKVEIEPHGQELNNFKEIIEKAVNAKAKATFRPCSYFCDTV